MVRREDMHRREDDGRETSRKTDFQQLKALRGTIGVDIA